MTKNEALKAAIDGKKIKCLQWGNQNAYVFWSGQNFYHVSKVDGYTGEATVQIGLEQFNDWEIVPEYVDFATEWKAYEEGKMIKCCHYGQSYKKGLHDRCPANPIKFSTSEIRGKWLILED